MKKTIFFDRDGTLIIDKIYLNDPDQIVYLPGAFEALKQLQAAGFEFAIVTNQSGVARGLVTIENIEEIHRRIRVEYQRHGIEFLGFYYAPYSVESNHPLRKPNPGMLHVAAKEHPIDLSRSWIVGDRMSDAEAGLRAGCRSVLLEGSEDPASSPFAPPTCVAQNLMHAAELIIGSDQK